MPYCTFTINPYLKQRKVGQANKSSGGPTFPHTRGAVQFTPLLLLLLWIGAASAAGKKALELVDIPDELITKHGAYSLDGSPYKYYIRCATEPKYQSDYVIYFQGGGWCFTAEDCQKRSLTNLGSSLNRDPHNMGPVLLRADALVNPTFHGCNHVLLPYCDGGSFTGNQEEDVDGLWYRGIHNLQVALEHMGILQQQQKHQQQSVNKLLVTGSSAGGLANYLHADYIGVNNFPKQQR
jgi:hypothetical protein